MSASKCTPYRVVSILCVLSVLFITAVLLRIDPYSLLVSSRVLQEPSNYFSLVTKQNYSPGVRQTTRVKAETLDQDAFWMTVSYTGQMTSSVADLIALQCFATTLDPQVCVVEPFLNIESGLGTRSFHLESGSQESLKLYDLYDKAEWNKVTSNYSPLVSWEYFIQNAPRKLIIVDPHCKELFLPDCHKEDMKNLTALLESQYGFDVVNTVYFRDESNSDKMFPVSEYKRLLYGGYSPQDVVVLFHVWGAKDHGKVDFGEEKLKCERDTGHCMPVSRQIRNDVLTYANQYMSTDGYISVMVRLEWFYIRHLKKHTRRGMSKEKVLSILLKHYKAIVKEVELLKELKNVSSVFLTIDCTEQGSRYFNNTYNGQPWVKKLLASSANTLFEMIHKNTSNLRDWEDGFYDAASSRNKGYIAQMQKYLAANGTCLITFGGGNFQRTAAILHKQLHQNDGCVHTVEY